MGARHERDDRKGQSICSKAPAIARIDTPDVRITGILGMQHHLRQRKHGTDQRRDRNIL
jgi:hypothetical protein